MDFGRDALLTGLKVFYASFDKRNTTSVSGRPFHGLTYRYSGVVALETESVSLLSGPGTMTYVPAGMDYENVILEAGKMIAVHFTMVDERRDLDIQVYSGKNIAEAEDLFRRLLSVYRHGFPRDAAAMAIFYEILSLLERDELSEKNEQVNPVVLAAKSRMELHFKDSQMSIASLADYAGVSESYLRRVFKAEYGITPSAYLKNLRMDLAKNLLKSGYYSVSEVARLSGFGSASYFSAEFHRMVGVAPVAYFK